MDQAIVVYVKRGIFYLLLALAFAGYDAFAGETIKLKNATLTPEAHLRVSPPVTFQSALSVVKIADRFSPSEDKIYYIIQFDGPVKNEWKDKLTKSGIKIGSYLPDDAFLAKIQDSKGWKSINSSSHVRSVIPYKTEFRVSKEIESPETFDPHKAGRVLIRLAFESEVSNFIKTAVEKNIPFVLDSGAGALLQIEALKANVEKLAAIEGVEWIEPAKPLSTFDLDFSDSVSQDPTKPGDYTDLTGYESGTKLMNFEGAYNRGLHGEGEIVGIADTGLDRGSVTDILDDFKNQVNNGYAVGLFATSWEDPQGHGTHTSGSIVGSGASSHGMLRGGAYGAKLIMQGMWSPMLNNLSVIPDFDKLFGKVRREDGVHIHSNSWGSPTAIGVYDNFASMVDEIAWKNPDLLIVFAAGNDGKDLNKDGHIDEGSVSSPSTAKDCLTVGASKNLVLVGGIQRPMKDLREGDKKWAIEPIASSKLSDNPNGMAAFSSIGPTDDGRIKPEIVAPGTNIVSTRSQHPKASTLWGAYNNLYSYAGGTSMATPLTSGAAAVVRQYLRQVGFVDPSAALIKAVMIHGATDLFPGQFGLGPQQEFKTERPNMNEGFGRVDVDKSTKLDVLKLVDETVGLKTGETKSYVVNIQAGQKVQATMTYTDAPASAGAAQALVNDLDLMIMDDKGEVYYPNHLKHPDYINNTEMIEFTADHTGTYTVAVNGRSVPKGHTDTGAQPFALILP